MPISRQHVSKIIQRTFYHTAASRQKSFPANERFVSSEHIVLFMLHSVLTDHPWQPEGEGFEVDNDTNGQNHQDRVRPNPSYRFFELSGRIDPLNDENIYTRGWSYQPHF
jgi:hypothetical protein